LLSFRESPAFAGSVEVPAPPAADELLCDESPALEVLAGGGLFGGGGGGGLLLTEETGSELLLLPESLESLLMITPPEKHRNSIENPIIHVINGER
jgi:hypothetical protein